MYYINLNLIVAILYHFEFISGFISYFVYLRLCYFIPNNTYDIDFLFDLSPD